MITGTVRDVGGHLFSEVDFRREKKRKREGRESVCTTVEYIVNVYVPSLLFSCDMKPRIPFIILSLNRKILSNRCHVKARGGVRK